MSSTPHRIRAAAAVAVLASLLLTPATAGATHGDDAYIQQSGNGAGASGAIIPDFGLVSSLYSADRFPTCLSGTCVQRPTFPKHIAFGVINAEIDGTSFLRVAMVRGSDDGLRWGRPEPATIQKPDGRAPFLLGFTATHFDVMFNGTSKTSGNAPVYPFTIYYKLAPVSTGSSISGIHAADSEDGVNWVNDRPLTQDAAAPLVGGTGTAFTYGPTDIIFQPSASPTATCAGPSGTTPWNCRYVMLYNRYDAGVERLGLAASADGTEFAAYPGAILSPGPGGSWDQASVGHGSIRVRTVGGVKHYLMIYSGSDGSGSCAGGSLGCMLLGTATSSDGVTWTKSAGNPMTPNTLPNAIAKPTNSDTIVNAEPVDDGSASGRSKVYFSAYENEPFPRRMHTYLGSTGFAPAAGPTITVASPVSGARGPITPVEVYVTDTLGTNIGEDLTTLSMEVDGAPVSGYGFERTTVTSYRYTGTKITTNSPITLAEGPHVFRVTVADKDGNVSTATISFSVDASPPATSITRTPASPVFGFPGSAGTYHATTSEPAGATGISRVRATVTNPIGQVKTWESSAPFGFNVTKEGAYAWSWNWVAPTFDPHFALPGEYRVTLSGVDIAGNVERASPANTTTVLVL